MSDDVAGHSRLLGWLFLLFAAPEFALLVEKGAPRRPSASLERILGDGTIWGKDFGALARILASAEAAGEQTLLVFPDRVVAGGKDPSAEEAGRSARRLAAAEQRAPRDLKPAFRSRARLLAESGAAPLAPQAAAFPEDDSFRVVWSFPGAEFVKPGLTMKAVRQLFGPPAPPTRVLIQNAYERRPIVLTLHSYAGGAIVFAESDLAPNPGMVDRILLDVSKTVRALFAG